MISQISYKTALGEIIPDAVLTCQQIHLDDRLYDMTGCSEKTLDIDSIDFY